jgi:hypothetical protein
MAPKYIVYSTTHCSLHLYVIFLHIFCVETYLVRYKELGTPYLVQNTYHQRGGRG